MKQDEFSLSDREFGRVKQRVYQMAGIALSDAKRTLVISRLSKILRDKNLPSFDAYVDFLETKADAGARQDFVNALTTNLTRFYREDHHFEHLCSHVEALMQTRPRGARLRLWSAGCSTGQEAYTMALALLGALPALKSWDFKILGTDIDTAVLAKAARGIYPVSELAGLTPERMALFETRGSDEIAVPEYARRCVVFKPLNLLAAWPVKGPFDAIFCRNVTIYFDKETQGEVFGRFGQVLAPEAFLYIGHSENVGSGATGFKLVGKTIYQSRLEPGKRAAA